MGVFGHVWLLGMWNSETEEPSFTFYLHFITLNVKNYRDYWLLHQTVWLLSTMGWANSAYPCSDSRPPVLLECFSWPGQAKRGRSKHWISLEASSGLRQDWWGTKNIRAHEWDALTGPNACSGRWVIEHSELPKPSRTAAPILTIASGERCCGDWSGIEGPNDSQTGVRSGTLVTGSGSAMCIYLPLPKAAEEL